MLNMYTSHPISDERKGESAASKGDATGVCPAINNQQQRELEKATQRFARLGFSMSEFFEACEATFPGSVRTGDEQ